MSAFDMSGLRYIQDPFAPQIYADAISDIRTFNDAVRITLESWKVNSGANPTTIDRVCSGSVVISRAGAELLGKALLSHLEYEREQTARMHEAPDATQ